MIGEITENELCSRRLELEEARPLVRLTSRELENVNLGEPDIEGDLHHPLQIIGEKINASLKIVNAKI
ncbi:MAG: hypothetical protein ACLPX5_16595 [Dissulfurispiraceae bacterium]